MLRDSRSSIERYPSSRKRSQSPTLSTTRCQKSLLSSPIRGLTSASSSKIVRVGWEIHQQAVSSTQSWSWTRTKATKSSTFTWHQPLRPKDASNRRISTCPRMSQAWLGWRSSSLATLCVTSISTGQVQSKCQLQPSMLTRSLSFTWTLEWPTGIARDLKRGKSPAKPRPSQKRWTNLQGSWMNRSISCETKQ